MSGPGPGLLPLSKDPVRAATERDMLPSETAAIRPDA